MKCFIFDFETFGQNIRTCPVINCSYTIFDWNRFTDTEPYTFDMLLQNIETVKLSIEKQKQMGYIIEPDTVKWWMEKPSSVKKQALPSNNDVDVRQFILSVLDYIGKQKIDKWWSRSDTFDPVILWRLSEDVNLDKDLNKVLPFWKVRDIRTYIDAKFDFKLIKNTFCPIDSEEEWNEIFQEHNSAHDVAADILRLQRIVRAENDL